MLRAMRALVGWSAALACAACGPRPPAGAPLANRVGTAPAPGGDVVLVHHAASSPVEPPALPPRPAIAPRPPGPAAPDADADAPILAAGRTIPTADDTDRQVRLLRRLAAAGRGHDRADALARIADLLTRRTLAAPDDAAARDAAIAAGVAAMAAPGFAALAGADHLLYDQGDLLMRAGRPQEARKVLFRLVKDFPASDRVPHVYLLFGDYYFSRGDLSAARQFFTKVLLFPSTPVASYARYKLAWVDFDLGRMPEALEGFVRVATTAPPPLGRAAADDAVRAYAQIGRADRAIPFFERVDRAHAIELAERLGRTYLDAGRAADAVVVLQAAARRETDPARACEDRVGALEGLAVGGDRRAILNQAGALAGALAGADCATEADRVIGGLAWAWHAELPKSEADPALVRRMWELAAQVATTPARRAAAARNRAELAWRRAESGGGHDPDAWADAAEAAQDAAELAPADAGLAGLAVDGWTNTVHVARAGGAAIAPARRVRNPGRARPGARRSGGAARRRPARVPALTQRAGGAGAAAQMPACLRISAAVLSSICSAIWSRSRNLCSAATTSSSIATTPSAATKMLARSSSAICDTLMSSSSIFFSSQPRAVSRSSSVRRAVSITARTPSASCLLITPSAHAAATQTFSASRTLSFASPMTRDYARARRRAPPKRPPPRRCDSRQRAAAGRGCGLGGLSGRGRSPHRRGPGWCRR